MKVAALSPAAPVAAIAFPLLLALAMSVPRLRPAVSRIAPWAALPALGLAVGIPAGASVELPWMLIGTTLYAPDPVTRGVLLLTAVLWLVSGWFASAYMANESRRYRFWVFFLASMAGNVGLVLAQDVVSFYFLFTLMTFAAYGLIVHEQTQQARRAAHVYFVLALVGELLLLAAFLLIARDNASISLEEARTAVATSPNRDLLTLLLLAGFGVKAGAIPMHVWLPLAHPVAPTPASAVLSGAMIKAGLLGWLRFLPLGFAALDEVGWMCAVLGFVAAIFGALVGAAQRKGKTVLAYSSISQMGMMTMVLGVLIASPETASASVTAVVFFALHHAVAKGSLFLGTAVAHGTSQRWTVRLVTAGLLLPALSIAGAPFSSGALGKIALHEAVEGAAAPWHVFGTLLSIAAIGSALIMIRFLLCAAPRRSPEGETPRPGLWLPWLALIACDVLVLFVSPVETPSLQKLTQGKKLWSATWPLLVGGALALAAWHLSRRTARSIVIPSGDLLVPAEDFGKRLWTKGKSLRERVYTWIRTLSDGHAQWRMKRTGDRLLQQVERAQQGLGRYGVMGSLVAILLLVIMAMLTTQALL